MFGWVRSKSATTFESFVSSAGETCHPFNVTVPEGAAGAFERSVLACDPAASTDATRTTASRAGTISLLRMLPPPRCDLDLPGQPPQFGALAPTPIASGIQMDLDPCSQGLLVGVERLPRPPNIVFARALVPDREPEDVAPVQACVRQENLAAAVDTLDDCLVLLVGTIAAEAHEGEVAGSADFPSGSLLYPLLELFSQPDRFPNARLQPGTSVAPQDRPELERAEAAPERRAVLGEAVDPVARAQELRDEAERAAQVFRPPRPEQRAVHRREEPLVRV